MSDIVIAVITHGSRYLIVQRNYKADFGGFWEFPGGKIESMETPEQALYREVKEEVGIEVLSARLFDNFVYRYPHKTLRFHVFLVESHRGLAQCKEKQIAMEWVLVHKLIQYSFPAANQRILKKIKSFARVKQNC